MMTATDDNEPSLPSPEWPLAICGESRVLMVSSDQCRTVAVSWVRCSSCQWYRNRCVLRRGVVGWGSANLCLFSCLTLKDVTPLPVVVPFMAPL